MNNFMLMITNIIETIDLSREGVFLWPALALALILSSALGIVLLRASKAERLERSYRRHLRTTSPLYRPTPDKAVRAAQAAYLAFWLLFVFVCALFGVLIAAGAAGG